ncbi:MAG: hypothetical protein JWP25_435 [Bradyrhizobium sp.]|nr:hypothetical protein [Bradyrhizobium sp.]
MVGPGLDHVGGSKSFQLELSRGTRRSAHQFDNGEHRFRGLASFRLKVGVKLALRILAPIGIDLIARLQPLPEGESSAHQNQQSAWFIG